jgi:hypothetical protein
MNTDEDYKWKQRDLEWFRSKIGQRVEYASLSVIKQREKEGLVPNDLIEHEKDAEYHYTLGTNYEWYYRVTHLNTGFSKGLIGSKECKSKDDPSKII